MQAVVENEEVFTFFVTSKVERNALTVFEHNGNGITAIHKLIDSTSLDSRLDLFPSGLFGGTGNDVQHGFTP